METIGPDQHAATGTVRRRTSDLLGPTLHPRDQLLASLAAPFRGPLPVRGVLAAALALVLLEAVGLVERLRCPAGSCGALAARLDMDALGSLPRSAITLLLLCAGLVSAVGVVTAPRHGARPWWLVLAGAGVLLAAAKAWSVHSLLERGLATVLPEVDVQLLFLVVSVVGLTVAAVSGVAVRRDTRWATLTWLALYAAASVGLAAVTNVVWAAGPVPAALATYVEETGEALAALGLLAVQVAGVRALRRRGPTPA